MNKRLIPAFILAIYSAVLVNIMVFKNIPVIRIGRMKFKLGGTHAGPANLVPFKTILFYALGKNGFFIAFINLAGNIVLLMPVGFIAPMVFPGLTWKKALILAVAAGLTIEGMQELLHVGIFDIDDVILNGLGVVSGFWLFKKLVAVKLFKRDKNV